MITRSVTQDNMTVVLGRETRFGTILRAAYRKMFIELYPELKDALLISNEDDVRRAAIDALEPTQFYLFGYITDFMIMAAAIRSASGLPFRWPGVGEVPSKDWLKEAFAHFLMDDSGLWTAVITAANENNAPLVAPEQQPLAPEEVKELDPKA